MSQAKQTRSVDALLRRLNETDQHMQVREIVQLLLCAAVDEHIALPTLLAKITGFSPVKQATIFDVIIGGHHIELVGFFALLNDAFRKDLQHYITAYPLSRLSLTLLGALTEYTKPTAHHKQVEAHHTYDGMVYYADPSFNRKTLKPRKNT